MIVLNNSRIIYFDVDDTLVDWSTYTSRGTKTVTCICPDSGTEYYLLPMEGTIENLKMHKSIGDTIVVWSQGGGDWAKEVIYKLNLQDYVDLCITKPHFYYDDLNAEEFMDKSSRRLPSHFK